MMKTFLAAMLLSLVACGNPGPDYDEPMLAIIDKLPKKTDKTLCGLYEFPHEHTPLVCEVNPWTHKGVCCTWVTEEFYSECATLWCLNENLCGWFSLWQSSCKPT